jgi:hypothetical protein
MCSEEIGAHYVDTRSIGYIESNICNDRYVYIEVIHHQRHIFLLLTEFKGNKKDELIDEAFERMGFPIQLEWNIKIKTAGDMIQNLN